MDSQLVEAPPVLVLARLGAVMRRAFARRMADEAWATEAGMRPGCFSVLRAVGGAGAAGEAPSQRALSDQLGIDPSDLVGLIDALEEAGYVDRRRDPADRRRYAIDLTAAGEEALGRFDVVAATVADDVFGVLPADERAVLEGLLIRVVTQHEAGAG